jgi:hypothetical protein
MGFISQQHEKGTEPNIGNRNLTRQADFCNEAKFSTASIEVRLPLSSKDAAGVNQPTTTHSIRGSAGLFTRRAYNTTCTKLESLVSRDATE